MASELRGVVRTSRRVEAHTLVQVQDKINFYYTPWYLNTFYYTFAFLCVLPAESVFYMCVRVCVPLSNQWVCEVCARYYRCATCYDLYQCRTHTSGQVTFYESSWVTLHALVLLSSPPDTICSSTFSLLLFYQVQYTHHSHLNVLARMFFCLAFPFSMLKRTPKATQATRDLNHHRPPKHQ